MKFRLYFFPTADQYKAINDEGMPHYQRPFMKGRLFVHFNVEFPESGALSSDKRKMFQLVLPPKQSSRMDVEPCEETILHDVNIEEEMRQKQQQRNQEAYEEDDDEPDAHRMGCNQQ